MSYSENLTRRLSDEMQRPSEASDTLCGGMSAYISCRHQRVGQHADVLVSVEPRDEQHAKGHVNQERHQDVGLPADRSL